MLPVKNLLRNKIRSALTMLGVGLGVALFVSVTAFSQNLKSQLQNAITKDFDLIIQSKGASSPLASRLTPAEYRQLKKIEGIDALPTLVIGAIKTPDTPYFLIAGISSLEPLLNSLGLIDGRLFHPKKNEILMGRRAMKRWNLKLNQKISLSDSEQFIIVGTYVTGSRIFDKGAVLSLSAAKRLLKREENVNLALAHIAPGYQPEKVMAAIQNSIPGVSVLKSKDILSEIRLFQVVDQFAWSLSSIALIIACVFVINTLMMSIYERTKEIGILMAVGWSRWMITRIIFSESIILCLLGGIFGDLIGLLFIFIFSISDITGLDWTSATLSPAIIVHSFALTLLLGLVSAIHPALVASRLSPAQAIRYE